MEREVMVATAVVGSGEGGSEKKGVSFRGERMNKLGGGRKE